MAENRSLSSSEQYIKKSNRKLLFIGLGLLVLFLVALMLIPGPKKEVKPQTPTDFNTTDFDILTGVRQDVSLMPNGGNARLVVEPERVDMNNVVLGAKAESLIVLTAENAPILFMGMELAETQQDGFSLESTCTPNK
ncbi:MAG: hypothetical protein ACI4QM_05365, partial [Alphaproteobacteria bacterium]